MSEVEFLSGSQNIPAYQIGKGDKGVILIADVYGYRYDEMRRIANLLAGEGFIVLLPDLFRGDPRKIGEDRSSFQEWREKHPTERVMADIKAAAAFMRKSVKKLAVLGFCWGGLQSFNAAQTGLFDSAVDFYGARMDVTGASKITCPFLGIFGGKDPSISSEEISALESELKKAKKVYQVKVFKDCGHAFVQKRENYNEQTSKEALALAIDWLKKTLA